MPYACSMKSSMPHDGSLDDGARATTDLRIAKGYRDDVADTPAPRMGLVRMARLALRTWPYMRPMLRHLLALLALAGSGVAAALVGLFVGTDLLNNKVLVGEGLQPVQAAVLFLGSEYVTEDPERLGNAQATASNRPTADAATPEHASAEAEPELTPAQRRTVRNRLILWGILGGIIGATVGWGGYYYSVWIWQCINQNLRVAMVVRAESLSLRFHSQARVGDAIFRVYQDSAMIVNLIQSGLVEPAIAGYALLAGLVVVAAFDPWVALMVVLLGVPVGAVAFLATPRIRTRALVNRLANSRLTSRTQEAFTAIRLVKANGAERRIFDRFERDSRRALDAAYFLRLDMALATLLVAVLGGLLLLATEFLMVRWVIEERNTWLGAAVAGLIGFVAWNLGAVSIARTTVEGLGENARGLLGIWMRMQDLFIALGRAFDLLDIEPEVTDPDAPKSFPSRVERVTWRSVGFGYDDGRRVLEGVNLDAARGTVTAIVGATGAGKSTLMALLLRLFDPDEGEVAVNGTDLRDFAVDDLRGHVAIALQKNVLFADTVANNIAFGAGEPERDVIIKAARVAGADDFIEAMPNGYDTELGERGGKLSAGQRQRLSIARAVVRGTPILILDEPTASLDARTEREVLGRLAEWGRERVILLITHRLSAIRGADNIALIESGRIAESGTHGELMARESGRYRAFVATEFGVADAPEATPANERRADEVG